MMSETKARKIAAADGVKVSRAKTHADGTKSLTVGSHAVTYNPAHGGSACWCVDGVRAGFVGEAIAYALDLDAGRPARRR